MCVFCKNSKGKEHSLQVQTCFSFGVLHLLKHLKQAYAMDAYIPNTPNARPPKAMPIA